MENNPTQIKENSVFLDGNIVKYIIAAPVDKDEAERLNSTGTEYLNNNNAEYVLIDIKQSTQFSSEARKSWVNFLQTQKIKRTAIFGGNVFVRTLASFVIAASNSKNIKFFNKEQDALDWLMNQ